MKTQNRIIKYDIIKAVAAFLICIYHLDVIDFGSVITGQIYYPNWNKFAMGICSAGVPLFFMINGVLILSKYNSNKYFIYKSINALKIYFIWAIICGAAIILIQKNNFTFENMCQVTNYLWFFQSLAFLYLFTILFNIIKKNKYSCIIPIIIFIYPFVINFLYDIFLIFDINIKPHRTGFFRLYSLLYFTLLFFYKPHYSFIKSIIFIIIGLFLIVMDVYLFTNYNGYIFDGVNSSFPTIGALFVTLGIYCICNAINYNINSILIKFIAFLGKNCLGIYLFHVPIIVLLKQYIIPEKYNIILSALIALIIITISAILFYLLKKVPVIKYTLKL